MLNNALFLNYLNNIILKSSDYNIERKELYYVGFNKVENFTKINVPLE